MNRPTTINLRVLLATFFLMRLGASSQGWREEKRDYCSSEQQPDSVEDNSAEDLREQRAELDRAYAKAKSDTEIEIERLEKARDEFQERKDAEIEEFRNQINNMYAKISIVELSIKGFRNETDAKINDVKVAMENVTEEYFRSIPFDPYMSFEEACELKEGDYLDHQLSDKYPFESAHVLSKDGSRLLIHYENCSSRWDTWSDYKEQLSSFARHESISGRPVTAEGMKAFLNPRYLFYPVAIKLNDQWVKATFVRILDNRTNKDNQILVKYCRSRRDGNREIGFSKTYHLDDTKHIRIDPHASCTVCGGSGVHSRHDATASVLAVTPVPEAIADLITNFVEAAPCRTCGATGTCAEVATSPGDLLLPKLNPEA